MNTDGMAGRLLVGLASLTLLAGCAAGASPTPVTVGPVTLVTGTHQCPGVNWSWRKGPGGTLGIRDLAIRCADGTDDARVSGTLTASANLDVWGTLANGAGVQWASVRLENAGGAWEGRQLGAESLPGRGDTMVFWYRGTGGYAGLAYFALVTGSEPWEIQGQIFPGDPPPPYAEGTTITRLQAGGPATGKAVAVVTGTGTCPGANVSWTHDPDETWHARDGTFSCTVTTDDPRVSGSETAPWNMDAWGNPDQGGAALVQWGTARLENAGGAWVGHGAGVYAPGRGDTIAFWYTGIGSYAGLSYFELWTGSDPWRIQGQIFPGDPPTP